MNAALAHPLYIAVKASLAALLALSIVEAAALPDRLSAPFVAVVCISPTVYSGLRRGLDQIGASVIGGAVTWVLAQALPAAVALGLSLFLAIYLCFVVGLARGFLVAAFTVLYVLILPEASPGAALEHRLASVAIGVASAIVLNLVVSALSWRAVFARRLAIARDRLSGQWQALGGALTAAQNAEARRALFEECFVLLRALFEELSDATRESRVLGGRARKALESALDAAHQLLAVAHHGKDVALLLDGDPGPYPRAGARALVLAAALREGKALAGEGELEPAVAGALRSAALACEKARAAEERFRG